MSTSQHFEPDKPWKQRSLLHSSDDDEIEDTSTHKKSRRSRTVPWLSRNSTASLSQGSSSDLSYKDDKIEEPPDNKNYKEDSLVGV
jgi:hypothetical protein